MRQEKKDEGEILKGSSSDSHSPVFFSGFFEVTGDKAGHPFEVAGSVSGGPTGRPDPYGRSGYFSNTIDRVITLSAVSRR
jgi:hypothetical protein